MPFWSDATKLGASWRERVHEWTTPDAADRVVSWIRSIALEGDIFYLDTPAVHGFFRFESPSSPGDRPVSADGPQASALVRFVIRSAGRSGGPGRGFRLASRRSWPMPDVALPEWRPIVRLRDVRVFERNDARLAQRPLRLGLDDDEGWTLLSHARRCASDHVAGRGDMSAKGPEHHARLSQRAAVAVALWTRGRLRGSVMMPPGVALRAVGQAAIFACSDARFKPLSVDDLAHTRFQVTVVHGPSVPLSRREIASDDAYLDKGVFVSEGTRSAVYLSEIFNIAPRRSLHLLVDDLLRHKAGLGGLGPKTSVEVSELTEFVESADLRGAVRLDGPVPSPRCDADWRSRARAAAAAACAWFSAIQNADGALPLRIRPSTGMAEGVDPPRVAMAAHSLAAFGRAIGSSSAVETARRAVAWLESSRPAWSQAESRAVLTTCYLGKAGLSLGAEALVERALDDALRDVQRVPREPVILAQLASFLGAVPAGRPEVARLRESLQRELEELFARAAAQRAPMSLAEWSELVIALDERPSTEVARWLVSKQLPSGAFPDTTASDFVYTRGTGKVFEALSLRRSVSSHSTERAARWLLTMQYDVDSMFFVPEEHRGRVSGGFRHDAYESDAWIDAAGHFLLGVARLVSYP